MDRADVLSGAAFKAVRLSTLIVVVILITGATVSSALLNRALLSEAEERVRELSHGLIEEDTSEDPEEFVDQISAIVGGAGGATLAYALFGSDGARMAGNTDTRPETDSWVTQNLILEVPGAAEQDYLLHTTQVGDMVLVVGRSLRFIQVARYEMIRGFAIAGFAMVLIMLSIGYFLSRRSQEKLVLIEDVLERVANGDTSVRLNATGTRDQIDRISHKIDMQLERLDALMQGTRRTAASVAHDLRKPLARLTLGLERALSKADAGADVREEIEDALSGTASLTSIIATILRIARIEGGQTGEVTSVDVRSVLDEIVDTFGPVAEDNGQLLTVAAAGDGPVLVRGDPDMIAQLVANLVGNAMAYAGDGAKIEIGTEEDWRSVKLFVSDNGPGIPDDLKEKVFEPFFRVDTARTIEGSGLGLPLVKAIVDRHGATLSLEDAAPGLKVVVAFPRI